jgi:hypothetical protein
MAKTKLTDEELLGEVEDILRIKPLRSDFSFSDENLSWLGRAAALIDAWDFTTSALFRSALNQVNSKMPLDRYHGLSTVLTFLHQARHDLRMKTLGPVNVAMGQGAVFDYFDEVRKIIEEATKDLLFVDPYLDAEFVPRYLPHIAPDVAIRLLAQNKLATLLPAVEMFIQQSGRKIQIRSTSGLHDRYVLVDGASCFQSGSSFKDGAKKSPTTLTQITDAFSAVRQTYEDLWSNAKVERS